MWCGTSSGPNATWCVPVAWMTQPGGCWIRPRTGSGSGSVRCCGVQVLLQPADVGGQPAVLLGGLADGGRARCAHHPEQERGIDGPGGDIGVPVPARAEV